MRNDKPEHPTNPEMDLGPDIGVIPSRILDNGVEEFLAGDEVYDQCARCGSSVTYERDYSLDGSGYTGAICLSGAEWCDAHPMPGRETQKGAGR